MNNIEEKFYMTFGLEKRCIRPKDCVHKGICRGAVACDFYTYPEITDRILLELICIYNNNVYENEKITPSNINTLKEDVLHWFITDFEGNDKIKQQIQQLFEEEK